MSRRQYVVRTFLATAVPMRLRHHARSRCLLLSDAARDVIEHGLVPGPAPDRRPTRAPDTE